ncbi:uncharacterized protein LOC141587525 [Silene latifolia]|uniref:uncharacterized protein LOC141587525 n=1 Tax=Silene latifolia TaxID=37657 RepID=UPI003D789699
MIKDITANQAISAQLIKDMLMERYGIEIATSSVYKIKDITLREINGGHDESYSELPTYCEVIKATNRGSVAICAWVHKDSHERPLQFKSIFISFQAQSEGLLRGCRSWIGVDGTHMKGNYDGVLLSAVALDANGELFPVAVAVVESENKDSWSNFFWHLKQIVKDSGKSNWTIISDMQKVTMWYSCTLYDWLQLWQIAKRKITMVRHATRQYVAESWPDDGICPNIVERLKVLTKDSRPCYAYRSGPGSGIPCRHVIRAIITADKEPCDFVNEWYCVRMYKEAYGLSINPVPDKEQWETYDVPTFEPPTLRRAIGRPSRNRRREPWEVMKGKRSV